MPKEERIGVPVKRQRTTDTTTLVTYSVMLWYTPEFAATFATEPDMDAFINLVIEETNQGYINSKIPVRVSKLDAQLHPTLHDDFNSTAMMAAFADSLPSWELYNCADAAALLIEDFDSCGIAKLDTTASCRTLSITTKDCATGYYSFGHEIGHNFGADHNQEAGGEGAYPDGHGYWIQPTGETEASGYRTIMAYSGFGHKTRVNYYSSPLVTFPTTGSPAGAVGAADNARVIAMNRSVGTGRHCHPYHGAGSPWQTAALRSPRAVACRPPAAPPSPGRQPTPPSSSSTSAPAPPSPGCSSPTPPPLP